ncbi:MAG: proline--tRNA ligase [bacterium]|nr:proline--tRNA ligase [bacterium]
MRYSRYFLFTSKEKPVGALNVSHSTLLRGNFISQLSAGVYNFLPIGFRVLKKVWKIIEEEMDRIGAFEVLMPALHPSELWKKTGRWETMDNVMFKLQDKKGSEFVLGTTHEEIITDIVSKFVKSYKNLPMLLYQIQVKFRDEMRPKGGLIRAREFIMKDLYSFHTSWECLDRTYQDVYNAYQRIFRRLSIPVEVVEAFSGPIGGDVSHEFMVITNAGEDKFAKCSRCGYSVSTEIAQVFKKQINYEYNPKRELQKVYTPNISSVEELVNFLKRESKDFVKSILYKTEEKYVLVLVRGDREINEIKLSKHLGSDLVLANEEDFEKIESVMGFVGPIGLKKNVKIISDYSVYGLRNIIVGANERDYHYTGVDYDNIPISEFVDLSVVHDGDPCFKCGGEYRIYPALELGHIFKLGTKYSEPLNAYFTDKDGKIKPIVMGCYGIGVSRIISAIVESYSDENSISWTFNSAPFFVYLITINIDDETQRAFSERIYNQLIANNLEVLWDDRKESAGIKFKDWELIGVPFCIIIGSKISTNKVELKINKSFAKTVKNVDTEIWEHLIKNLFVDVNVDDIISLIKYIYVQLDKRYNEYV